VIDACIELHLNEAAEYTSNAMKRSYPDGLDVEVLTAATLDRLDRESIDDEAREHVTTLIYRHPEGYRCSHLMQSRDLSGLRWCVDTPADFRMVEAVYRQFLPTKTDFRQDDVLALLERRPDIVAINVET